ncbi:hypothetical protein ACI2LF_24080 [Kribbella sp. NPDC020789]
MGEIPDDALRRLKSAAGRAGIEVAELSLLRLGDSVTIQVNSAVIAKVTRFPDQQEVAHWKVAVSRWLASVDVPAVRQPL